MEFEEFEQTDGKGEITSSGQTGLIHIPRPSHDGHMGGVRSDHAEFAEMEEARNRVLRDYYGFRVTLGDGLDPYDSY